MDTESHQALAKDCHYPFRPIFVGLFLFGYEHTMKTIAPLFLFFAFTSFGFAADKARESQSEEIREAVFRWQFDHNTSGHKTNAQVYFLSIGEICQEGDELSDEFMKRFANHKPPVRKVSASTKSPSKGIVDKKTGEKGLIFSVTNIEWKSDTEVHVSGGYCKELLDASGNTYTVKKQKGKWKVTNAQMNWMS